MRPGNYNKKVLDEYKIEVYSYSTLPKVMPNGFWVLGDNFIVPCHNSNGAHYGVGLIILSSLGVKKYQVKLNFIIQQYKSMENFSKEIVDRNSIVRDSAPLSYEEVYLAMYSTPVNAVRVNKTIGITSGFDIRTPFISNKKNINLAKDIAMFYNLDYNYAAHIS
jgi:hypothetical protein